MPSSSMAEHGGLTQGTTGSGARDDLSFAATWRSVVSRFVLSGTVCRMMGGRNVMHRLDATGNV